MFKESRKWRVGKRLNDDLTDINAQLEQRQDNLRADRLEHKRLEGTWTTALAVTAATAEPIYGQKINARKARKYQEPVLHDYHSDDYGDSKSSSSYSAPAVYDSHHSDTHYDLKPSTYSSAPASNVYDSHHSNEYKSTAAVYDDSHHSTDYSHSAPAAPAPAAYDDSHHHSNDYSHKSAAKSSSYVSWLFQ